MLYLYAKWLVKCELKRAKIFDAERPKTTEYSRGNSETGLDAIFLRNSAFTTIQ